MNIEECPYMENYIWLIHIFIKMNAMVTFWYKIVFSITKYKCGMNAVEELYGNVQQLNYISLIINIPLTSFSLEIFHGWPCNTNACFLVMHQIRQYSVFVMVKGDQLGFVFITFISNKWNPFQWMCLANDVLRNHLFLECVLCYVSIMNAVPHCIKWIAMNMVWINYGYTNKYKNRTMYIYIYLY